MKRFSILALMLAITLALSACGAQATPLPTANPVDLQSTAAAVAITMIAETQAAVPTATPPLRPPGADRYSRRRLSTLSIASVHEMMISPPPCSTPAPGLSL